MKLFQTVDSLSRKIRHTAVDYFQCPSVIHIRIYETYHGEHRFVVNVTNGQKESLGAAHSWDLKDALRQVLVAMKEKRDAEVSFWDHAEQSLKNTNDVSV
jgi:hypothetical protein